MGKTHLYVVLLLAVVAVALAVVLYQRQDNGSGDQFGPTQLFDVDVGKVAAVEIKTEDESLTVQKTSDEEWGMESRGGYPINAEKLRQLVFSVVKLTSAERKSSNPEKYDLMGVGETPETASVRLLDADGKELAGVYVGKTREGIKAPGQQFAPPTGQFIRKEGDPHVYVVKDTLTVRSDVAVWLESEILKIDTKSLRQVRVDNRGTTDSFTLARAGEDPFEITTPVPAGFKVNDSMLNRVSQAISNLRLDDVLTADDPKVKEIDFATTYTAAQKNGLEYRIGAGEIDKDAFVRVNAGYNRDLDFARSDERTSDSVQARELELPGVTIDKVRERYGRWVYQVPSYQANNLKRTFSELLEAIEEEGAEPTLNPFSKPMLDLPFQPAEDAQDEGGSGDEPAPAEEADPSPG